MADAADYANLKEPLAGDNPCGDYLEDTQAMAAFDALRLFGLTTGSPDERKDADGKSTPPDWRAIRQNSLDALEQSKDFRLLAHLAASAIRLEGLAAFVGLLDVAAHWITHYWDGVYPPIDDDAIFRRNALNGFADRFAIVDALRRLPLVTHPQLGRVALRDIDGAGDTEAGEDGGVAQVAAVFASASVEQLQALQQQAGTGLAALKQIEARMREEGGSDVEPDFDPLNSADSSKGPVGVLVQIERITAQHLAARGEAESPAPDADDAPVTGGGGSATVAVGAIRSRQDAVRALDAVAAWFRQNEPSSPVPMFVDRARRLVSMSFLDILEDVAPDGVGQARSAGGVRADE